jgi:hypothetical protein
MTCEFYASVARDEGAALVRPREINERLAL